jgi:hypothetical protein
MGRNRLKEGQATVIVGVRLPSSLEYQITKHVRRLKDQGHETTKSEVIRALLEKHILIADQIFLESQRGGACSTIPPT